MNETMTQEQINEVLLIKNSIYCSFIYDLIDHLSDEGKQKVDKIIDHHIDCIKDAALESSCPDMNRLKLKYDTYKFLKKEL